MVVVDVVVVETDGIDDVTPVDDRGMVLEVDTTNRHQYIDLSMSF